MALVVAIAGMILPAISVKVLSVMIVLKCAPLLDRLTLDVELGFKFKVEDSSS
jgi:hypothetical protein